MLAGDIQFITSKTNRPKTAKQKRPITTKILGTFWFLSVEELRTRCIFWYWYTEIAADGCRYVYIGRVLRLRRNTQFWQPTFPCWLRASWEGVDCSWHHHGLFYSNWNRLYWFTAANCQALTGPWWTYYNIKYVYVFSVLKITRFSGNCPICRDVFKLKLFKLDSISVTLWQNRTLSIRLYKYNHSHITSRRWSHAMFLQPKIH